MGSDFFAYGAERAAAGGLSDGTVAAAVKSRRNLSRRKPAR